MKVESLSGFEGLDAPRWNALVAGSSLPSVFLSWQWQTAWARAFLGGRALGLLAVSEDSGALAGLLPLYEEAAGPLMRFAGARAAARAGAATRDRGPDHAGGPLPSPGAAADLGCLPRAAVGQGPPRAAAEDAPARGRAARDQDPQPGWPRWVG